SLTRVDLTSEADVAAWAAAVMRDHGPPDLLLNNAGVINENAPLWEVSEAEFDLVIDVNLKGITRCIRHFAPAMVARRSGVIVNFSSGWGRSVSGDVAPYCATKWGVEGLTKALAQELPSGTAAVALNPGVIDTDMLRTCLPDLAPSCPDAEAWSQGIVQFLTDLGPQHNGQSLTAP
ncbi:MAG TPA: SDR family oxidoreductase, partial [Deltaproteobacteria bacterium]|nr:SDR family oxidoreductase [Deltaproteobacteria bacterium]